MILEKGKQTETRTLGSGLRLLQRQIMLMLTGLAVLFMASPGVWADIAGSEHDFSASGWSGGEICIVCHTPHNGQAEANAPLWNHAQTASVFSPYSSSTFGGIFPDPGGQPLGVSKLCLSCHDGTVAVDSFGGGNGTTTITGSALIGTDLGNDHPISFEWHHQTTSSADGCGGLQCHPQIYGSPEPRVLPFFGNAHPKTVECATCHDVHNNAGYPSLLRATLENSELCRICHVDKGVLP